MRLRFIYRTGCSLCDAMWAEWRAFLSGLDDAARDAMPTVECVDIGERPELEEGYGQRVPVMELDGHEICRYFFDPEAFSAYLS